MLLGCKAVSHIQSEDAIRCTVTSASRPQIGRGQLALPVRFPNACGMRTSLEPQLISHNTQTLLAKSDSVLKCVPLSEAKGLNRERREMFRCAQQDR